MWCPPEFRRVHSSIKRKEDVDSVLYDPDWVRQVNLNKQRIRTEHYNFTGSA